MFQVLLCLYGMRFRRVIRGCCRAWVWIALCVYYNNYCLDKWIWFVVSVGINCICTFTLKRIERNTI